MRVGVKESPQFQVTRESDRVAHCPQVSSIITDATVTEVREALAIAVQPGLTVSTLNCLVVV